MSTNKYKPWTIRETDIDQDLLKSPGPMSTEAKKTLPSIYKTSLESLEDNIVRAEKRLETLKEALTEMKELPFKEGDVAFHKGLGNVLVKHIFVGDSTSSLLPEERDSKLIVNVVTLDRGCIDVLAKDLFPITPATKVLFNEGSKS